MLYFATFYLIFKSDSPPIEIVIVIVDIMQPWVNEFTATLCASSLYEYRKLAVKRLTQLRAMYTYKPGSGIVSGPH